MAFFIDKFTVVVKRPSYIIFQMFSLLQLTFTFFRFLLLNYMFSFKG